MTRNGGGAAASAGYHDKGGCFDLRVWNLTEDQIEQTIRTLRRHGAAAWLRNAEHGGFDDPHIHLVLGSDSPLASGAQFQWDHYLRGGDGMRGKDYHWRPEPLVTTPPEDEMAQYEDDLKRIEKKVDDVLKRLDNEAAIRTKLSKILDELSAKRDN